MNEYLNMCISIQKKKTFDFCVSACVTKDQDLFFFEREKLEGTREAEDIIDRHYISSVFKYTALFSYISIYEYRRLRTKFHQLWRSNKDFLTSIYYNAIWPQNSSTKLSVLILEIGRSKVNS